MFLKQSTATVLSLGPFVSNSDGVTLVTSLVAALDHASTGIKLSKAGGALTIRHATVTATTYDSYGNYLVTLDTTDTATLGRLRVQFADATTNLPVWADFEVVTANVYNALIAGTDNLDVNTLKIGPTGSGTAQTARDIGASVLLSTGTGTGQLKLASGYVAMTWADIAAPTTTVALTGTTIATTQKVDIETIKTNPVVNAGTITFPTGATLASTTNITTGTIATVTTLTNLPAITAGWLTATGIATDAITAAKIADGAIDSATFATGTTIPRCTLTDTITTYTGNTVQTGDSFARIGATGSGLTSLAPSATALTSATWTGARANYLDNLNVGGAIASQADVQAVNQSASKHILIQTVGQYERPESGSSTYTVELRTFNASTGAAVNADSTPTISPVGAISGSLAANLGAVSNPATGVYRATYTVSSSDAVEQIRFDGSATISSSTFTLSCYSQVVDLVSVTWTATDATHLTAIYNKLPVNNIADETLVLAAISGLNNLTATQVWAAGTRTLTSAANITSDGSTISQTQLAHLDADVTSRMATYTQPTGFLAATFPGTVASPTNITAGVITTVTTLTNLPAIPTDWLTAAGVKADAVTKIQLGLATPTNITAGVITTVTNLTNAPTSGDFTSTMKTSIGTVVAASAVASVTGNVGGTVGSVVGAVGSVTGNIGGSVASVTAAVVLPSIPTNWITAAGINAGALNGKGDWLLSSSYTAPPTVGDVADAVWDEVQSGHVTAGTFGKYLDTEISSISGGGGGSGPTAAAIATAVWQDVTAGDFTVAGSIGKSLFTAGVIPGAASGLALVGSAMSVTGDFSATMKTSIGTAVAASSVTSVTGSVGSVAGTVDANVVSMENDVITDSTIAVPAETPGIPTRILGMLRRLLEKMSLKRTRNHVTGEWTLYGADDTTVLETQTQSTVGDVDTISKSGS